jgi:hypothetical protein
LHERKDTARDRVPSRTWSEEEVTEVDEHENEIEIETVNARNDYDETINKEEVTRTAEVQEKATKRKGNN